MIDSQSAPSCKAHAWVGHAPKQSTAWEKVANSSWLVERSVGIKSSYVHDRNDNIRHFWWTLQGSWIAKNSNLKSCSSILPLIHRIFNSTSVLQGFHYQSASFMYRTARCFCIKRKHKIVLKVFLTDNFFLTKKVPALLALMATVPLKAARHSG